MRLSAAHLPVAILGLGLGVAGVGLLQGQVRSALFPDRGAQSGGVAHESLACASGSCADGIRDGTESDVDCGRDCRNLCAAGQRCEGGEDCGSGICEGHHCATASCEDGVRNGGEADVDCGGPCAPCGTGASCAFGEHCASGVCDHATCAAPSCFDRVMNEDETGVDCGGSCDRRCAIGDTCAQDSDCESNRCLEGYCGLSGGELSVEGALLDGGAATAARSRAQDLAPTGPE
jgi:hypothetical protein